MSNNDGKFNVSVSEEHTPLAPDEPTFTFRGQDKFMPAVLGFYAELCEGEGAGGTHIGAIYDHLTATLQWQERNGCKIPD